MKKKILKELIQYLKLGYNHELSIRKIKRKAKRAHKEYNLI